MPRNGSGVFSLATTFTPDTDALAEDVNTQFEDIRDAITGSVAADGQTTITGAMKFTDGSAAAPGITFAADTNSGIYRIGADSYGFAAGGALVATLSTTGWTLAAGKTLGSTANIVQTANITDNAVTLAKLATQADATVLANVSGGAAVPTAVGYTALFDDAFGGTQGTILYRGASDWAALGVGTSGQFLKTQGAAANPTWGDVLPSQTGNSGEFLTTDGTSASWAAVVFSRGSVSSTGVISGAVNATASQTGTGAYSVTFSSAASSANYTVVATANSSTTRFATVHSKTVNGFSVETFNVGSSPTNASVSFEFLVFGG